MNSTSNENPSVEVFYSELGAVIGRVGQADLTLLYLHFWADEIVEQESGDTLMTFALKINISKGKSLTKVGFEPTPPERLEPKSSALDHSATLPWVRRSKKRY